MDSLDDILNRVLQNSAEKVVQRIEPVMHRRPLRDPQTNATGFFQDLSAAVRNIRSPESAVALQSQGFQRSGTIDSSPEDSDGVDSGSPSSSADRSRRTTIGDDVSILGQVASSATQVVLQIATAGKAIGQFTGNLLRFDNAFARMTRKAASSAGGSGESSANVGGVSSWLESSSIADSVRGLFARFRVSPAQMTGTNSASSGGSVSLSQQDPGSGESFVSRISQSLDRALAKSSMMFRQMNRQSRVNDDEEGESWLNSSSISNSVRSFTRNTVSRLGRRALNSRALRQRVMNGQRLIRGRVRVMPAGGGGAGAAAGGGGGFGARIGGFFGGMFGGGGGGAGAAAAGGGGAAGGGAGGAAVGGAMAGGAAIAGVALAFVAIAAVAVMVVKALYDLGMAGYKTALRVAQFDGQLAAAKSQLDVSRMVRDIGTARTLSEAGAGFMKSLDKLEQALRPLTDGAMEVGLNAMIVIIDFVTWAFKGLLQATNSLIKGFDVIESALGLDLINAAMLQRLDNIANGQQAGGPINVGQRGFFDGQLADRPFRQPRPPLPPMGGGNGN